MKKRLLIVGVVLLMITVTIVVAFAGCKSNKGNGYTVVELEDGYIINAEKMKAGWYHYETTDSQEYLMFLNSVSGMDHIEIVDIGSSPSFYFVTYKVTK